MSVKVVTGFVPLVDHPRSAKEYETLGKRLLHMDIPLICAFQELTETWLYKFLLWNGDNTYTHSISDNPKKNTVGYHVVQHQKFEWLVQAAYRDPADVFVWIDYGIFHVPGVTEQVILDFLAKVEGEKAISIPGCWTRGYRDLTDDTHPNWRFCGGVMIVPKQHLLSFECVSKAAAMQWILDTKNVSWEVNTLARLEETSRLPIWHYHADHNETMFTNYPGSGHGC
jgi:hypothetical protein